MPFWGVDDVLLLLASTTAVLWAKRTDIIQTGLYQAVRFMTHNPALASKSAGEAARKHAGSPLFLLKGFDLENACKGNNVVDIFPSFPTLAKREFGRSARSLGDEAPEGLVRRSLLSEYDNALPTTFRVSDIPHRRYNFNKKLPDVTQLADYTEEEVSANIGKYSLAAVESLFADMGSRGDWEAIVRVSRGIEGTSQRLKYLTRRNVQSALRVLIACATSSSSPVLKPDLPLAYYFNFAKDMLLDDDIIIALFDLCRYSETATRALYESLLSFQADWSSTVYACCLTTVGYFNYEKALQLYEEYRQAKQRSKEKSHRLLHPIRYTLTASKMDEPGRALHSHNAETSKLGHLYHIIIPLVIKHDAPSAHKFITDMMTDDAEQAPDVFLKCLASDTGHDFADAYLKQRSKGKAGSPSLFRSLADSCADHSSEPRLGLCDMAYSLYMLRPSATNMNSLLKVILNGEVEESPTQGLPQERAHVSWDQLFRSVPLTFTQDVLIIARTIVEHSTSYQVAEFFLLAMILRRHFSVVPLLAFYLASHGRWPTVQRTMTIYLSNQRGCFSQEEIALCVEAAVHNEQWSSVLFWVERAHTQGLRLSSRVYDIALSASVHWSWQCVLQVVKEMRAVGGVCSNEGLLSLMQTAGKQRAARKALKDLSSAYGWRWSL